MNLAGVSAVVVLLALAALHVHWAAGGRWPGDDDASLAARVVGTAQAMPSGTACAGVAVGLVLAAFVVWRGTGGIGLGAPSWPMRAGAAAVAGLFALRGLGGFFEARLRPAVRATPYHRLNVRVYSPGCIALAALIGFAIVR